MHATNTVSLKHRKYKEQVFSALRGIASRAGVPRAPSVFRHSGLRPLAAERFAEDLSLHGHGEHTVGVGEAAGLSDVEHSGITLYEHDRLRELGGVVAHEDDVLPLG